MDFLHITCRTVTKIAGVSYGLYSFRGICRKNNRDNSGTGFFLLDGVYIDSSVSDCLYGCGWYCGWYYKAIELKKTVLPNLYSRVKAVNVLNALLLSFFGFRCY